jgi:hypothetical protein
VTDLLKISFYAKFWITDFTPPYTLYVTPAMQSTAKFFAYGSYSSTDDSTGYYITETSTFITIS